MESSMIIIYDDCRMGLLEVQTAGIKAKWINLCVEVDRSMISDCMLKAMICWIRQNAMKKVGQNAVKNEILLELFSTKTQYGLQAKRNGGLEAKRIDIEAKSSDVLKQNTSEILEANQLFFEAKNAKVVVLKQNATEYKNRQSFS
ncbi:hypothetical protein Tco_0895565 [Tanacetum coccineum]|uniref:Uncharacterized protein n=1 Tax=Tanacetum coccineum TaxID=301880 RepID=A0ABQ5CG55_9ASTR